jgi:hypothetical protein
VLCSAGANKNLQKKLFASAEQAEYFCVFALLLQINVSKKIKLKVFGINIIGIHFPEFRNSEYPLPVSRFIRCCGEAQSRGVAVCAKFRAIGAKCKKE